MTGACGSARMSPTLVVRAPGSYAPERRYILDLVLSEWLGFDYDIELGEGPRVTIRLAGDPQVRELTLPDILFSTPSGDWLTARSMPARPLQWLPGGAGRSPGGDDVRGPLPVLYGDPDASPHGWQATADGVALSIDVLGGVFFLVTRYEEVARPTRDQHGRFPASASLAAVERFLERPIADEYVDLLWMAMHLLWPGLERRPSAFRLRLTHDVDLPWASLVRRALAGDILRRRDPVLAVHRLRSYVDARSGRVDRDPFNTFDLLMQTSEQHGLRSTFYFLASGTVGDADSRYRLADPPVADLLRRIHQRGHDVGLHGSYVSCGSAERMRAELDALQAACRAVGFDQPTWGVRQHFLRLDAPRTWRNHELAGLDHNSTLGFADHIGFRAGTGREYPLFDLSSRRALRLRERPLLVMDGTLFGYMALGFDEAASRTRAVVEACRRQRSDAVVLFHNDTLGGARQRAYYRGLVAELARPA